MLERWRRAPACNSGRNGASNNLFVEAAAAAWSEPDANGAAGPALAPIEPPAPAEAAARQQAPGSGANLRMSQANGLPPASAPRNHGQGQAVQLPRQAASQHSGGGHSGEEEPQRGSVGGPEQQTPREVEVIDFDEVPAAASNSSPDSWDDRAAASAQQNSNNPTAGSGDGVRLSATPGWSEQSRNRLKRKAGEEPHPHDALVQRPRHPPDLLSAEEQHGSDLEVAMQLTSLSQLEELRDAEYPVTVRMHGSIVGLVRPLLIIQPDPISSREQAHSHDFLWKLLMQSSFPGMCR